MKVVVVEVPTCAKLVGVLLQFAPAHRSIKYWLIVPPVSVAAVQERVICAVPAAVAVRFGDVRTSEEVVALLNARPNASG